MLEILMVFVIRLLKNFTLRLHSKEMIKVATNVVESEAIL